MDEPTSSLPREDVERLFALIRRLRERGVAIVYISHFLEEVREIADRFTVLRDGRSVAHRATARTRPTSALIAHMVGRPMDALFPERAPAPSDEVAARGARSRGAAGRCARRRSTLRRGEILGIAGLIGSGRTEMVRALMGLDPADRAAASASHGRRRRRCSADAVDAHPQRRRLPERGSQGRGARARRMSLADNITLHALRRRARRAAGCSRRAQRDAGRALDRRRSASRRARRVAGRRARSRAAISRRSRSRACCTRRPTCCCSTSRPRASTSAARSRSIARSSTSRRQRQGRR